MISLDYFQKIHIQDNIQKIFKKIFLNLCQKNKFSKYLQQYFDTHTS